MTFNFHKKYYIFFYYTKIFNVNKFRITLNIIQGKKINIKIGQVDLA